MHYFHFDHFFHFCEDVFIKSMSVSCHGVEKRSLLWGSDMTVEIPDQESVGGCCISTTNPSVSYLYKRIQYTL